MSFILHWQTTDNPTDQTTGHATLELATTAAKDKAIEIQNQTWFKLWIEDGVVTYRTSEKL